MYMERCTDCQLDVQEACGYGVEDCNSLDTKRGRENLLGGLAFLESIGEEPDLDIPGFNES
jgi:hypothetical protein